MAGVRSLLVRTRRLQAAKVHPVLAAIGGATGWDEALADAAAGMADGRYDRRDMRCVVASVQIWISSTVY